MILQLDGGAQKMLYNITKYADLKNYDITVISLLPLDTYRKELEKNSITVYVMNIKVHPIKTIKEIIKILKTTDTLFCWMYASNFIGYICGKSAKVKKINMGIRQSNIGKDVFKFSTRILNKIGAKLSHSKYITNVIYNGEKAKTVHEEIGYDKSKSYVIINGCELNKFHYIDNSKEKLLNSIPNLKKETNWIISATRYNKIKDIPNFIKSMDNVKDKMSDIQIFMCGNGFYKENKELITLINETKLKIDEDIFLMGLIDNLPEMFSACDLYVLHSAGEAFPNTLLEAMACEIECIATNAGDSEKIHPNKNNIVPIKNSEALSNKVLEVIKNNNKKRHPEYRKTVQEKYSIENVVKQYEKYY